MRFRTLTAALALLLAALTMSAAPAAATDGGDAVGAVSHCSPYVSAPEGTWGQYVSGTGGVTCSTVTTLRITVRVRQDRKWRPDRTLASTTETRTGNFFQLTASRQCSGVQGMRLFTETIVDTLDQKVQSSRVSFYC
jgi:hypothetical protein